MARSLIVNADDLGWSTGVNRGIAEAHRRGILTSASLLAGGAAFSEAVTLTHGAPDLGVGVHLNLSDGPPVANPTRVPSLVNAAGHFDSAPESLLLKIATRALSLREIETEWDAQIAKVRDAGVPVTHLDGHKHVHMLPGVFEIALRLAKRYNICAIRISHEASSLRTALSAGAGMRASVVLKQGVQARGLKLLARDARTVAERAGVSSTDYFCGIAQTGELTKDGVIRLLRSLPEGTTELMCHPGYLDDDLLRSSTRLRESRERELQILTDPDIRNLVASEGIRLIDYGFLATVV